MKKVKVWHVVVAIWLALWTIMSVHRCPSCAHPSGQHYVGGSGCSATACACKGNGWQRD